MAGPEPECSYPEYPVELILGMRCKFAGPEHDSLFTGYPMLTYTLKSGTNLPDRKQIVHIPNIRC